MGRRARGAGVSNADVKQRHEYASEVGRAVYRATRDLLDEGETDVPANVMGPLTFLGEHAAPAVARFLRVEPDEALLRDIAAYLTSGYLAMITQIDREHFEQWRREADDAERRTIEAQGAAALGVDTG